MTTVSLILMLLVMTQAYLFRREVKRIRKDENARIARLKEAHREEFEKMMYRWNHVGEIPASVSSGGLLNLITISLVKCIGRLDQKQEKEVARELEGILLTEVRYLHKSMAMFTAEKRSILNQFYEESQEQRDCKSSDLDHSHTDCRCGVPGSTQARNTKGTLPADLSAGQCLECGQTV